MQFEWDEGKRRRVIAERRVDPVFAARIFRGPVLTRRDPRDGYGEARWLSTGLVGEECYVVVHTLRGETIRLITAWKGGRRDRARYQESLARGDRGDGEPG